MDRRAEFQHVVKPELRASSLRPGRRRRVRSRRDRHHRDHWRCPYAGPPRQPPAGARRHAGPRERRGTASECTGRAASPTGSASFVGECAFDIEVRDHRPHVAQVLSALEQAARDKGRHGTPPWDYVPSRNLEPHADLSRGTPRRMPTRRRVSLLAAGEPADAPVRSDAYVGPRGRRQSHGRGLTLPSRTRGPRCGGRGGEAGGRRPSAVAVTSSPTGLHRSSRGRTSPAGPPASDIADEEVVRV